jgi:hypothetical protein
MYSSVLSVQLVTFSDGGSAAGASRSLPQADIAIATRAATIVLRAAHCVDVIT